MQNDATFPVLTIRPSKGFLSLNLADVWEYREFLCVPRRSRSGGKALSHGPRARTKRGLTFPMARWMKSATPEMQEMAETGSLVKSAVHECWTDFSEGRMHWSHAWALTVLGATN